MLTKFMLKSVILIGFLVNMTSTIYQDYEQIDNILSFTISASARMALLTIEQKLQQNLSQYVDELRQKVLKIRLGLIEMRRFDVESDIEAHLSNPLSSFALLRHMLTDWPKWLELMQMRVGEKQIRFHQRIQRFLPKSKDLQEAAKAVLRIQQIYHLEVKDIARGLLDGRQYDTSLSALDCFEIGLVQHDEQRYDSAAEWFKLVLVKYYNEDIKLLEILGLRLADTFLLQINNLLRQNKRAEALQIINRALQLQPHNMQLSLLKFEFMANLKKSQIFRAPAPFHVLDMACGSAPKSLSTLHCHYERTNTPFLKLAPLKLEELSSDPYIVIYHNVLYDSEIAYLKAAAMPYLQPSLTYNFTLNSSQADHRRTAESVWFEDSDSPMSVRINHRIIDMTGFKIEEAESLQAIQYGLGGHYQVHQDFFNSSNTLQGPKNDRLATVLFYMTDVTQGGGTMFPYLDLIVYPTKGSALLWLNLDNAGNGNRYMLHAACPVIVGSKWVLSKWIDVDSQMFIKPCLKQIHEAKIAD